MMTISSSGLVVKGNEILLVRHTYGMLKGRLLIPGGRMDEGELPNESAEREVTEETGVVCTANQLCAARMRPDSIWFVFACKYNAGDPTPNDGEVDMAIFMNIDEALQHPDVTETMKVIINAYRKNPVDGLYSADYVSENFTDGRYLLYL